MINEKCSWLFVSADEWILREEKQNAEILIEFANLSSTSSSFSVSIIRVKWDDRVDMSALQRETSVAAAEPMKT